jgi:uncharacterized protein (DUF1330 family)
MAAYVITDVDIIDPEGYKEYQKIGPLSVTKYGGRFLAQGGGFEVLKGKWLPKRLVIIEFESAKRAKEWWSSEEYRAAKAVRQRTADTKMVIVEGL